MSIIEVGLALAIIGVLIATLVPAIVAGAAR
jgi:type II secretory pathway pseudopilin PulG